MTHSRKRTQIVADTTVTFDDDTQVVVYWADLTLWQASKYLADRESFFLDTELPIRERFSLSTDDYWAMTVSDHARMVEHIGG